MSFSCGVKKRMLKCLTGWDPLSVVQFKHFVEQIKCFLIMYFAQLRPRYFFFLHLVRNQATISIFECDLFYRVWPKHADEGDQVANRKVLYFGAVVEREHWVALRQKTEEDHSTCPDVNCTGLVGKVKQSFGRHVAFSPRPVLDFHLLLKLSDSLYLRIVSVFAGFARLVVHLQLGKPKVN